MLQLFWYKIDPTTSCFADLCRLVTFDYASQVTQDALSQAPRGAGPRQTMAEEMAHSAFSTMAASPPPYLVRSPHPTSCSTRPAHPILRPPEGSTPLGCRSFAPCPLSQHRGLLLCRRRG